jgi:hypothetical protein
LEHFTLRATYETGHVMNTDDQARLLRRGRLQLALTVAFGMLTILAVAVPMWIEEVSGLSPDAGNGELELLLGVPFGLASLVLGGLTWRTRRQRVAKTQSARM